MNFPLLVLRFIIGIGDNLTSGFTRWGWNIENTKWFFGMWFWELDVIAVDDKLLVSLSILYYDEWKELNTLLSSFVLSFINRIIYRILYTSRLYIQYLVIHSSLLQFKIYLFPSRSSIKSLDHSVFTHL